MPSAAEKAFAIPELLENILLNLPWRHLFALQRLCKDVLGTISASLKLQKKMHLAYKTDSEETAEGYRSVLEEIVLNDLYIVPFLLFVNCKMEGPTMSFRLELESPVDPNIQGEPVGIRVSTAGSMDTKSISSWRKLKLSHVQRPEAINVALEDPQYAYSLPEVIVLRFDAGKDKVGDFVDALSGICHRSMKKQRLRDLFARNAADGYG